MILKGLTRSMSGASMPFSITRLTTSIPGWWKFWAKATLRRWATIPIPLRLCAGSLASGCPTGFRPPTTHSIERLRIVCRQVMLAAAILALSAACQAAPSQAKSAPARPAPARPQTKSSAPAASARVPTAVPSAGQQLETLAHQLNQKPTASAYQQLGQFGAAPSKTPYGARAALALGYYDFKQNRFPEARAWLEKAAADPLLSDYALYWMAMTDRASGANPAALSEFQQYRQRFPNGVMTDSAVEELARAALAAGRPQEAVAALDVYEKTGSRAPL